MRSLVYLQSLFFRLTKDNSGAVSAEYTFLITFIAIVATLGMVFLGPPIANYFPAVGGWIPDTQLNPVSPLGS